MMYFFTPERFLLETVRIHLVGAGGTGSEMLDALARMDCALRSLGHPGFAIKVFDHDTVSATNLVRQRFLPGDEGQNKATVLVHRYNVFLGRSYKAVPEPFKPSCHPYPDLLVTCTDSATLRKEIFEANCDGDTLWLDTGNDARQGQVVLGHPRQARDWHDSFGLRLPNVGDLYPEIIAHPEQFDTDDTPSCSAEEALARQDWPVNRMVAICASNLVWQLLRYGKIDHHGTLVDTASGRISPLPIDEQAWAAMGYDSVVE